MTFPWSIYFGTLAVATIAAGLSHAFWEHAAARFGLLDEPGPRKIHARIIPLSGGLTVLTGLLLPLAGGGGLGLAFFGRTTLSRFAAVWIQQAWFADSGNSRRSRSDVFARVPG